MAAATLHSFNAFLTERLTAAAVDIYGFVEKTVVEYQEEVYRTQLENQRLQRMLDLVYKPDIRLHRAGRALRLLPATQRATEPTLAAHINLWFGACSSSFLPPAAISRSGLTAAGPGHHSGEVSLQVWLD